MRESRRHNKATEEYQRGQLDRMSAKDDMSAQLGRRKMDNLDKLTELRENKELVTDRTSLQKLWSNTFERIYADHARNYTGRWKNLAAINPQTGQSYGDELMQAALEGTSEAMEAYLDGYNLNQENEAIDDQIYINSVGTPRAGSGDRNTMTNEDLANAIDVNQLAQGVINDFEGANEIEFAKMASDPEFSERYENLELTEKDEQLLQAFDPETFKHYQEMKTQKIVDENQEGREQPARRPAGPGALDFRPSE